MTFQVFLSEKAQHDLDALPTKIARQIAEDCSRLALDPVPDGKRIKKLKGYERISIGSGRATIELSFNDPVLASTSYAS